MISTNTFKQTLRYSHRLQIILFLAAGFLLLSTLLRTALLIKTGTDFSPGATTLLKLFSVGLIMDSITAIYYMLPFALLVLLMPNRLYYHFIGKLFLGGIIFAYLFITLFVGAEGP